MTTRARRVKTSTRQARAKDATDKALSEGLLNTGDEHGFFKAMEIGEARETSFLPGRNGQDKTKLRMQWWAPAGLVRLNSYMKRQGYSSKLRTKTITYVQEGRPLPDKLADAVAGYTEQILSRP